MNTFLIGADPELFVGDGLSVRSIINKIGGTKTHPRELPLGPGFGVQEDNVALEFNIPPSSGKAEFVHNITIAKNFLETYLKSTYDLSFVRSSAISFPEVELQDPAALVFGCEPDYCVWTMERNPRPNAVDKSLRSCGGHVHVGVEGLDPIALVKAMDVFLGVPSVIMDTGELRKQLYGKAGAYRKKSYGVEYRTLSNYWVFDQHLIEWVYDGTERAVHAAAEGLSFDDDKETVLQAINNNSRDAAMQLINKHGIMLV